MERNWTGQISNYFITNGKLTFLILIGTFIWGVLSFFQTPKKYNPTIVAPAFQIVVDYPGATREEVYEQITKPLENVVSDIAGVEDIYSTTFNGGRSVLNVNFFVGEDINASKVALNDRINSDMNFAPMGINKPMIISLDPEDVPVMQIALSSDELDAVELRKLGFKVRDRLSTVEGTSRIFVVGGRKKELSVEINPKKLASYGIAAERVEQALTMNNIYMPSGLVKGKDEYKPIQTYGWISTPEEAKEIVVATNDSINIKLGDVAKVEYRIEEIESHVRHIKLKDSKRNTVLLSVAKLTGTNISEVTDNVEAQLDELKSGIIPANAEVEIVVNEGAKAKSEINGLMTNLMTSIGIVVLVLFIFLSFKAAMLVAIAIPLTLSIVFGLAYLNGQSINRITLFALILSLGMLVDNATVVIENIVRKTGEVKRTTLEVFTDAVNEVGPGLFMSTVTTVLAFIPMAFISGMMGPYMGPIPFFVPAALITSLIISFTINPWMGSVLLKKEEEVVGGDHRPGKLHEIGTHLMMSYRHFLRSLLENKKKTNLTLGIVVIALLFVVSFPAFKLVKFRMLPKANVNQFYVYLDMKAGTSLEKTLMVSKSLEKKLLEQENIEMVQSFVGTPPVLDFNGLFKGASGRQHFHQATLRVGLSKDKSARLTSEDMVLKLRPMLNQHVQKEFAGEIVKLKLIEDPPGPPVLSTYLVRVQGWDKDLIEKEAKALFPHLKKVEGVTDMDSTQPEGTKTIEFVVDHFEASKTKTSPAQIVSYLNTLYSGKAVGIFHQKGYEQELIRIRFDRDARFDLKALDTLQVPNAVGIGIPLSRLVKKAETETISPLMQENHKKTIYLFGEMGNRSVTYAGIDTLIDLVNYNLSDGKGSVENWNLFGVDYKTSSGEKLSISIGGEWELTLKVFRDLMIAMAMALLVIYLVLVAQFSSFSEPLLIMSTIPLGVLGVFPGFYILNLLVGEYFTATSMIGVIALAGIAVNNSIILLEYLNGLKIKRIDLDEALIEAAATRLRPIALTTVTTMLGSMTILGDPVWSGLAWAIILGLGMSSALILIVFPILYKVVRGKDWHSFH